MRVSVCEFLRVSTQMSWVNMGKDIWWSDGMKLQAHRDDVYREKFHLYTRKGKFVRSVTYYEGLTAREVRAKMR